MQIMVTKTQKAAAQELITQIRPLYDFLNGLSAGENLSTAEAASAQNVLSSDGAIHFLPSAFDKIFYCEICSNKLTECTCDSAV